MPIFYQWILHSNPNTMLNAVCTQFKFGTKKSIFKSVNIWKSQSETEGEWERERVCMYLKVMLIPKQEWQIAKTYHRRHHILWFCSSSTMHIQYSIHAQDRSQKKHFRLSMNDSQRFSMIDLKPDFRYEFFNKSQNPKWFRNKFFIYRFPFISNTRTSKCRNVSHNIESTVIIIYYTNTIFDTKMFTASDNKIDKCQI